MALPGSAATTGSSPCTERSSWSSLRDCRLGKRSTTATGASGSAPASPVSAGAGEGTAGRGRQRHDPALGLGRPRGRGRHPVHQRVPRLAARRSAWSGDRQRLPEPGPARAAAGLVAAGATGIPDPPAPCGTGSARCWPEAASGSAGPRPQPKIEQLERVVVMQPDVAPFWFSGWSWRQATRRSPQHAHTGHNFIGGHMSRGIAERSRLLAPPRQRGPAVGELAGPAPG